MYSIIKVNVLMIRYFATTILTVKNPACCTALDCCTSININTLINEYSGTFLLQQQMKNMQ